MEDRSVISLRSLTAPGLEAVRRFWRPFLLIQGCAVLLVVSYFKSDAVRAVCDGMTRLHQAYGLLFSGAAAALAGGILPEIAKAIFPSKSSEPHNRLDWKEIAFTSLIFGVNGMLIDLQYRAFAWIYGNDGGMATATKKMLTDQFITTPLYGVAYFAAIYAWRAHGFRLGPLLREIGPRWYITRVIPVLIPAWFFWIPMVFLTFLLPVPLQFFLFSLALAAWSLILLFIARSPLASTI